jgi:hypothetical protein
MVIIFYHYLLGLTLRLSGSRVNGDPVEPFVMNALINVTFSGRCLSFTLSRIFYGSLKGEAFQR